ncbi:hypothetical protein [Chryseobacterium indologenes]|uniref:hypothetical protein n=1 Tax=Chryseobacterium indologenes TaxID=253 RepID=UPI003018B346
MKKEKNTNKISTNKQELLNKIIAFLKGKQVIETKKDLAEIINYNDKNLTSASNGNTRYLTDSLFRKIYNKFPEVQNLNQEINTSEINYLSDTDIKTLPHAEQMELINKKLDYLMKSEELNRVYLKTLLAFHDIKIDMFESKENELDQIIKTVN